MKEKINEFKIVIFTLVIGVLLVLVTNFFSSIMEKQNADVRNQLSSVNNQISSIDMMAAKEETVVRPFEGGLDVYKKASDDEIIYNYVYEAFTFSDSYEYNENRQKYVDLLGETNHFVVNVMPPYEAVYSDMGWETDTLDDGTQIRSSMSSLHSFVVDIRDDGSYEYFTIVNRQYIASSGFSSVSNVYLTYVIDTDGNVLDFTAATQRN